MAPIPGPDAGAVCTACVGEPAPKHEAAPAFDLTKPFPYEVPLTGEGAGLRTDIDAGEFKIVLDAGRSLGGNQSGPSPVQAFISSILACTQIMLQVVAGGHGGGVDVSRIAWTAHAVFDARKLLGDTPTSPRFDRISLHGAVAGGADQATLDELAARTKERCPISQSLHPEVVYEVVLTPT